MCQSKKFFDFFLFSVILSPVLVLVREKHNCNAKTLFASFYMKSSLEEKSLLYKVQADKDPDAFALLYDQYVEPIYRFIYFKISHQEEAEDVTGEVFLKCWQYLVAGNASEVRSFSALIYTIARNQIIEVYRHRAKRPESPLDENVEQSDGGIAARALAAREDVDKLLIVLRKLKQEYQEVLLLRYVEDFSIGEIARITGKSGTNVRVTIHRALKKLKSLAEDIRFYA